MNKQVEKYIVAAMPLLKLEKSLNKELKGYISSLGPSMRMSGVLPAIAFYCAKEERNKVMQWIFEILKGDNVFDEMKGKDNMLDLALELTKEADKKKLEKYIEDASIALKLCLRTFTLIN